MNKKLMSLLLVLVLALPMVFVTVNALAAEKKTYPAVQTSGGVLNVWAGPVKKAGSAVGRLKNGTKLDSVNRAGKVYSMTDKRWMVYITAGDVEGWVDLNYVGSRPVVSSAKPEPVGVTYTGKLRGTAPNSIINIWGEKLNAKGEKPVMKKIPMGYVFEDVQNYSNKWSYVTFKTTAEADDISGWVQTKYLVNIDIVPPKAK